MLNIGTGTSGMRWPRMLKSSSASGIDLLHPLPVRIFLTCWSIRHDHCHPTSSSFVWPLELLNKQRLHLRPECVAISPFPRQLLRPQRLRDHLRSRSTIELSCTCGLHSWIYRLKIRRSSSPHYSPEFESWLAGHGLPRKRPSPLPHVSRHTSRQLNGQGP